MKSAAPFFDFFAVSVLAVAKAEMTLPNVVSDLLIFAPSFRRAPVAPVELALSDPARSTRLRLRKHQCHFASEEWQYLIRDTFSVSRFVSASCRFWVRTRVKTAWDREELLNTGSDKIYYSVKSETPHVSFICVAATVRALFPSSMRVIISS